MSGILASALAFASRGHAVLPLWWPVGRPISWLRVRAAVWEECGQASARPACPARSALRHDRPRVIKNWWGYQVPDANLGVDTGKLVVIDVDPRHGGDESFAALEHECELPLTWRALTGGGGEHVLFAAPDGVEVTSFSAENMNDPPLGKGVDIRAHGGYIVAPPSRHISGQEYAWSADHHPKDTPLAPAPELIERLSKVASAADGEREPRSPEDWQKLLKPASEYADDVAFSIAGHLFAYGLQYPVVLELMRPWARENGLEGRQSSSASLITSLAKKPPREKRGWPDDR